ncbi:hypothetical protein LKV13_01620 [Borrelia sp. BU AG58]|nr:hypothetical protein [Borrelia sp. BU AG58]UER67508.1 hypothetical protein LKV13_01620 [Borrelia sp. BU AG58]
MTRKSRFLGLFILTLSLLSCGTYPEERKCEDFKISKPPRKSVRAEL